MNVLMLAVNFVTIREPNLKEPLDLLIVMLKQFCLYIFGLALIFRRFALIFSGLLFLTFLERGKREHSREALQQSCFSHTIFT